jgi:DNA-binding response OmpR family regulator
MKLLIVDDEQDVRDSLAEFFEDNGYDVFTAANGTDAWKSLDSDGAPRAVVLDLMMPSMSGHKLYERMQSDERFSSVPVIISTSDPSRAPSGLLIMKKPINLQRLLGAVKQATE